MGCCGRFAADDPKSDRLLDHEAELVGHLARVARVLRLGQRAVERPVDAHTAQQRVLRVGREAVLGQYRLRVRPLVPHDAGPAGVAPGRGAQADARVEAGGEGAGGVVRGEGEDFSGAASGGVGVGLSSAASAAAAIGFGRLDLCACGAPNMPSCILGMVSPTGYLLYKVTG